ncbi:MAG: PhoH family protein, partial [Vicinamibacteria bacterium]
MSPAPKPIPKLIFDDNESLKQLLGENDRNLRLIEKSFDVEIHPRGNELGITGPSHAAATARRILCDLYDLLRQGYPVHTHDVETAIRILSEDRSVNLKDVLLDTVSISSRRGHIVPKSLTQKRYLEAIRRYDLVFSIGPAGTGKTYLAMAMAVSALLRKEVSRIILARPAVEAGEKLGFLPGTLYEKVNPYLRPLYDALHDMMDFDRSAALVDRGVIEVAPLGFMRGRTLNDSFVILDEAQNTTSEQMKMFLTRLGFNSKMVIT